MINVVHKRVRWTSQRGVEFVSITPGVYSQYPASQGWTDIRYFEVDLDQYEMDLVVQPNKTVPEIARAVGAEVAVNGPFAYITANNATPIGHYVKEGKLYNQNTSVPQWIDFILTKDRKPRIAQLDPENVADIDVSFAATPELVRCGKSYVNVYGEKTPADVRTGCRPRTALGIKPDGKLLIAVVDGDASTDAGLRIDVLAQVMIALGCESAMNLDGGGSSCLVLNGEEISGNPGTRRLGAAVVFKRKQSSDPGPDEMTNPVLIIDPGHGGKDPGGGSNEHWLEKDMVLDISLYQYRRFLELGVPVTLTRKTDVYLSPEERTRIVRESGAKYCISNHINAGGGDGAETIHSIHADSVLAAMLAQEIEKEGQNIRRVFSRTLPNDPTKDYYFMHRNTGAVETVIIEYGFADSKKDDVQQLLTDWKDYAEAVVRGFCKHIGHPYSSTTKLYCVQVGAFSVRENAEHLAADLRSKGYPTIIKEEEI